MTERSDRELSERWNRLGRSHMAAYNERIAAFYAGTCDEVPQEVDPRDEELARRVLERLRELNETGDWARARQLFDPAWEPFLYLLDDNGRNLPFATVLGPDSFLLRLGSEYEAGKLLHIDGDSVTPLAGAVACAVSPSRRILATAYQSRGIVIQRSFAGPLIAAVPWPSPEARVPPGLPEAARLRWERRDGPPTVSDLRVSDEGDRLLVISAEEGLLLYDARAEPAQWRVVLPDYGWSDDIETLLEDHSDDDPDGPLSYSADMLHADLLPDGRLLAAGEQCSMHYLVELDADKASHPYAKIGPQQDYPHFARFSGDGCWVALNSCHFYNGTTGIVDVMAARGLETEPYEEDDRFFVVDENVRVYAATWLPPSAVRNETGAFVLAGAGWMKAVTPGGEVLWDQLFGSTASSLDYCPETNTLLLGSYSGMLHLFDPGCEAEPGREIGFRPRKEKKRWIFWRNEARPLQW